MIIAVVCLVAILGVVSVGLYKLHNFSKRLSALDIAMAEAARRCEYFENYKKQCHDYFSRLSDQHTEEKGNRFALELQIKQSNESIKALSSRLDEEGSRIGLNRAALEEKIKQLSIRLDQQILALNEVIDTLNGDK